MAKFDAQTRGELRDVQEVAIRTDKHPKSAVVIWVVAADDEVFVRSWRGAKGRWYKDLAAGGPATLEFAGRRLAVQALFEIVIGIPTFSIRPIVVWNRMLRIRKVVRSHTVSFTE
jgi:hypothetical protein